MPWVKRTSVKASDYSSSTSAGTIPNFTAHSGGNGNVDATVTPKVINSGSSGLMVPTYAISNPSRDQRMMQYFRFNSGTKYAVRLRTSLGIGTGEAWNIFLGFPGASTVAGYYRNVGDTGELSVASPSLGLVTGTDYAVEVSLTGPSNNTTFTVKAYTGVPGGTLTPFNFNSGSNTWSTTVTDGFAYGTATNSYPALYNFYGTGAPFTGVEYYDNVGDVADAWRYWVRPESDDTSTSLTFTVKEMPADYQVGDTVEVKIYQMPLGTFVSTSTAGGTLLHTLSLNQFPFKLTGLTANTYYCYVAAMTINGGGLRYLSSYATQAKTKTNPVIAAPGDGIYGLSAAGPAYFVAGLGNSLVGGSNITELASQLAINGRTVTTGKYAVSGSTAADLASGNSDYVNNIKTPLLAAIASKPAGTKLVIGLRMGTNDAAFSDIAPSAYLASLQQLVNRIQADFNPVYIDVLGDFFFWGMNPALKNWQSPKDKNDRLLAYRAGMGALTGVHAFADNTIFYATAQNPDWTSDGTHQADGTPKIQLARYDAAWWKQSIESYEASLAPPLTGINLTHGNANGQGQYQWTATPVPSNASLSGLVWSISAGDGSIDQSGLQSPRMSHPAPYTATVTATVGSVQGQGTITVPGTDTVAPSIVSVTVAEDGLSAAIVLNESVTGNSGFTFNVAGTARTATVTGSGATRTAAFAGTTPVYQGQAVTFGYSGDGLTDAGGNHPATVTGAAATNNSTQVIGGTVSGVTIDPAGPVELEAGQTQQFTQTVAGTGNFDPAVTWSKLSGVGTVNTSGLYTAPTSQSTSDREAVLKCASVADPTKFDTVTVLIEGVPVIPPPSGSFVATVLLGRGYVTEPQRLTAGDGPVNLAYYADVPLPSGVEAKLLLRRGEDVYPFTGSVIFGPDGLLQVLVDEMPEAGDYKLQFEVGNVAYPHGFPIRLTIAPSLEAGAN